MKILLAKLSVWCTALAISGMFFSAAPASADFLWNWHYNCSEPLKCKGGSGSFTTPQTTQGSGINAYYVIDGLTGTVEGNIITSLLAPGSLGQSNDNRVDTIGAPFPNLGSKVTGIAFLTNNDPAIKANVNLLYNLFIDNFVGWDTQLSGPNNIALESINFSAKNVGIVDPAGLPVTIPEPSSILYTMLSILMLGVILRKRSQPMN